MNNSQFIAKYLIKKGINTAFGVTGGGAMFLNEAFRGEKKMKFIFTHHEQSATMAADAYYRIKKKPAVASVTSGPGGTNAITGVIGAWIDSIPMIIISGQVETKDLIGKSGTRQIGIQEANIIDLVKPITKYAKTIKKKDNLEKELNDAIKLSEEGRPGPVWLDIPLDIQSKKFKNKSMKKKAPKKIKKAISKEKLNKIYNDIQNSKRPLILIGNGVHISKSEENFKNVIKKMQIPFLSTWNASDIIPTNNNLYFGRPGLFGNRISNFSIQACDLLIIIGSRLSIPITGYQIKNFSPHSKKIYIDIDQKEILKRNLKIYLPIKSDIKFFLEELNNYLKSKKKIKKLEWIKKLSKLKKELNEDQLYKKQNRLINSFNFVNSLSEILKGNEVIVTDMGTSFTCTMQTFKVKKKQRLFTSSGIAAMGFGLPGIIGAYFANKRSLPICITGDGGIMFNIQELQTIINYKIPVKIFLLNNNGYLTMKLMQKKNFKKFVGSDDKSGVSMPNFMELSKSLGFSTCILNQEKDLKKNLKKIIRSSLPTVCEIKMPSFQQLVPRVQTQMNKDGSFEPSMIDNMYPFLKKSNLHKIRKNLLRYD